MSMIYKFFDKKIRSGATIKAKVTVNEDLALELHTPVIKKLKRRKIYARFKDDTWAAKIAKIGSLSYKNLINIYYV